MNSSRFDRSRPFAGRGGILLSGVSAVAISVFGASTPAFGQTTPANPPSTNTAPVGGAGQAQGTTNGSESVSNSTNATAGRGNAIVVTGIRQSLRNAQNVKRNSDTVEDVITATDIGALPDRSVTEALQRVPGVSINRFAAPNDPDHFSVEGSGVIIRGLTYTRSEFNGRDTFSTGVYGEAINFADVPAELLGSVEVLKETTADRIEGGLSGTVNMNLRLPFDNKGLHIGYDLEANYGDLRKKWSPVGSLLVSDNWDTGIGRIGFLAAGSYSRLFSRADGVQISNFQTRDGTFVQTSDSTGATNITCRVPLPSDTDNTGFPPNIDAWSAGGTANANAGPGVLGGPCFGTATGGPDGLADFASTRYAPVGGQFRTQEFDRKRKGIAAAFQWQSLDRRALLTAQFLRSEATQDSGEWVFQAGSDLNEYDTFPVGCRANSAGPIGGVYPNQSAQPIAECPVGGFTNYQYNDQGVFQKGYITEPQSGWRGSPYGAGWGSQVVGDRTPYGGMETTLDRDQDHSSNIVQDHAVNLKFSPTPHWDVNLDAQYVKAKHDELDFRVYGTTFADQEVDLTGQYPVIIPHKPDQLGFTWSGPSPALANASDNEYFTNPRYSFWRSAMDHIEHSRGHEWAFKGDVAYNFLDTVPFLKQFKFGARYSDREQDVKYSTYNWGSVSEVWGSAVYMDQVGAPQGNISLHNWDNFFRGQTAAPPPANYYNGSLTTGYDQAAAFMQQVEAAAIAGGMSPSWVPLADRQGVVPGTPFLPGEIQSVGQKAKQAYAMLRFGSDDPIFGNVRLDGNIGVRYSGNTRDSGGSIQIPSQQGLGLTYSSGPNQGQLEPYAEKCAVQTPPPGTPAGPPAVPGGACVLGPQGYAQLAQWATGVGVPETIHSNFNYWLPSVNLKFGITRDLNIRFAASKDLAYPALQDIRDYFSIGLDSNGHLTAGSGNPRLKPITSDNLDATIEWYFAGSRVGAITADVFAKNIHNYVYNNELSRDITSNGITLTTLVRGPANYSGTGKVRGFELSYTQTYDFLPGLLSGFGLGANYTYVTSKGVPNSFLNGGLAVNTSPIGQPGNLPLAQLSKHTFNLEPFYEKGPLSVRLAYNWRSKFLMTEADVIFPYMPIYQAAGGTLDGSIFYDVTPKVKIGVQAQNLTNQVVKTLQQYTLDGRLAPRSYFMADRRFSFIIRGTF